MEKENLSNEKKIRRNKKKLELEVEREEINK